MRKLVKLCTLLIRKHENAARECLSDVDVLVLDELLVGEKLCSELFPFFSADEFRVFWNSAGFSLNVTVKDFPWIFQLQCERILIISWNNRGILSELRSCVESEALRFEGRTFPARNLRNRWEKWVKKIKVRKRRKAWRSESIIAILRSFLCHHKHKPEEWKI